MLTPVTFFGKFRRQGQILDPDRLSHFDFIFTLICYALPPIFFKTFLESNPVQISFFPRYCSAVRHFLDFIYDYGIIQD